MKYSKEAEVLSTASPNLPPDTPFLNILSPDVDLTSPEAMEAQRKGWYAASPLGLVVIRYAEAYELIRDRRLQTNGNYIMDMYGIKSGPVYDWYVSMLLNRNGDDHQRMRNLLNRTFTTRVINNLRPAIRQITEELIDPIAATGRCDFMVDFGDQLVLTVMRRLLGIPDADHKRFHEWIKELGLLFSIGLESTFSERVEKALLEMKEFFEDLVARKLENPADDLISSLAAAYHTQRRVSMDELFNLLVTLVFSAHDATRAQFVNTMLVFADHTDQWLLLRERPELTAQAVEEIMRFSPSGSGVYRFAVEDFEYQGLHIPRDSFVGILVPLAQRDPRVFKDPERFDITVSRDAGPIQFGGGPHHCLGAVLARVELAEALPVLTRRLGPPTLTAPFPRSHGIRSRDPLLLSFD